MDVPVRGQVAHHARSIAADAWLRAAVGLVIAGWVLAGCGFIGQGCESLVGQPACTHAPDTPPGGISQAAAVRLAPAASADPTVVWATVERDPFVSRGTSDARLVWEVRLEGSLAAAPCPSGFLDRLPSSADKACLDGQGGLIVVLDYYSGAFVGWSH